MEEKAVFFGILSYLIIKNDLKLIANLTAEIANGKRGQNPALSVHVPVKFGRHL
jgi:hypothetical protein